MKFVIQNALNASVTVDEQVVGKINQGYVVFIGIYDEDDEAIADKMIQKMIIIGTDIRRTVINFTIYPLRRLPAWKPSIFYKSR